MGDVARSATSPPVTGAGEPERDANGLKAAVAGVARSLLPSITGEEDAELEELLEAELLSFVPSVPSLGGGGFDFGASVPGCGEEGAFPVPGVN